MDEGKLAPSDAELIERCLRKDNAAWELVVARFRRKVFHISYKFTGKHDEAEDLTQEIFLKVFRSLDKFNRDADFSTWLSSVARSVPTLVITTASFGSTRPSMCSIRPPP